jgi:hypothetical protein
VKLTTSGAELHDLNENQVKTYENCLSKIICNVPSVSCYQGDCEMCPGTENLINNTEKRFEDNTDNIIYRQWMTTDRSTLETTVFQRHS